MALTKETIQDKIEKVHNTKHYNPIGHRVVSPLTKRR
jgi:hypothetical protein